MNFCNDKKKALPPTPLIAGNLYSWSTTPDKINLCIEMMDGLYMVNIRTGKIEATNPDSDYNLPKYTDVTHRFCVTELGK